MDDDAKSRLVAASIQLITDHADLCEHPAVYVLTHDVPATNWGVLGTITTLDDLSRLGNTPTAV